jgi:hypothetical protein
VVSGVLEEGKWQLTERNQHTRAGRMDQISRDQNTDNSAVAQTTLWFGRNTGIGQDQNTAISTSAQTTLWVGRNRYTPCAIQLKLDANLHK